MSLTPSCRALLLLLAGAVATVWLASRVDAIWVALLWAVLVGVAYFPLARSRCPKCGRFPLKYAINIGGMPFLCFWPHQECNHCKAEIVI